MEPGLPDQPLASGTPSSQTPESKPVDEEDRERRRHALRELAQRIMPPEPPPASVRQVPGPFGMSTRRTESMTRPSRNRPRWFLIAGALLALLLVAVLVLFRFLTPAHFPAPGVVTIDPGATNLACAQDAAWSPDGTEIAVLGYHVNCPNADPAQPYESGQVTIYRAKTGKRVTSLSLDPLTLRAHQVMLGQPVTSPDGSVFAPFIGYQAVLWSPNGQQLAFPFVVLPHPYDFPAPTDHPQGEVPSQVPQAGVLLTNLTGTSVQVLVAPNAPAARARLSQVPRMEWNVQTGALISSALTLPPALSYQWGANGALLPLQPLNTRTAPAAVPPASVGDPDGGESFTIWQPGLASQGYYLTPVKGNGTGPTATATFVPGLNLWYSNFAVWSPDGQYLMTPAYYGGRMVLPSQPVPSSHDLQATSQEQAPVFPPHDQALQQYYSATKSAVVAWRPDGKVLATLSFRSSNGGNTSNALVTLWDTTTGKQLTSYTVKTASAFSPTFGLSGLVGSAALGAFLRWSPDGLHLLLLDAYLDGLITMWPTH